MRNFLSLPETGLFTNKKIFSMLLPVLIEQAMITAISVADVGMSVYVGETAVAGISLITTIDNLMKQVIYALAIGGSVVASQYLGNGNNKLACRTTKQLLYSVFSLSAVVCAAMLCLRMPIVGWLAGHAEPLVRSAAETYLLFVALSIPFYGIYYVATVSFRAMGNTTFPMLCSLIMMGLNLLLKWFLIYKLQLGVAGAGLSTLLAAAFIGIAMLPVLQRKTNTIRIERPFRPEWDKALVKKILGIGVPNSIENGMFQLGLLLLQRLTSRFGTYALAANAIAKTLSPLSYTWNTCCGLVLITIVGQSMGARETGHAKMYIKHLLKLSYTVATCANIFMLICSTTLVKMYDVSPETAHMAAGILRIYCGASIIFYPLAFVLPQGLRGAGDTKFTMRISVITMFCIRIGFAYLLALYFNMGLYGIWIAMTLEWVIKALIYTLRYRRGNWQNIQII